jgi:hypothetical protein
MLYCFFQEFINEANCCTSKAKLFYEPSVLKMVTTKAIAAGDQIV